MEKKPITAGELPKLLLQLLWAWIAGWALTISDFCVNVFRRRAPR